MRVWINNPFDFLPGEGGRLQRYALLSRALAKSGCDVVWWSSDWNHLEKARRVAPGEAVVRRELGLGPKDGRVEIRLVPTFPYYKNVSLRRVWSHRAYARKWVAMARGSEKPGCIVVSSPPLSLFSAAEGLARRWDIPVALDVQDLWPEVFYQVLPRWARGMAPAFFWPLKREARHAYENAGLVTVVAESYRAVCKGAERFALGAELPRLPAGLGAGPNGGRLRVCYIGNLGWAYRLETCVEAMERLAREGVAVELEVAGDGPQRGTVEAAERKGVPIHYRGMLDGDGLDALLRECAVGIVPMVSETAVGVPNKLCDYAAYGLAIASSLGGESRALVEKYGAGAFYRADDPTSLATVLKNWRREPGCLEAMRKGSRRLAEEEFDAGKIYPLFARRILELAHSV